MHAGTPAPGVSVTPECLGDPAGRPRQPRPPPLRLLAHARPSAVRGGSRHEDRRPVLGAPAGLRHARSHRMGHGAPRVRAQGDRGRDPAGRHGWTGRGSPMASASSSTWRRRCPSATRSAASSPRRSSRASAARLSAAAAGAREHGHLRRRGVAGARARRRRPRALPARRPHAQHPGGRRQRPRHRLPHQLPDRPHPGLRGRHPAAAVRRPDLHRRPGGASAWPGRWAP